MMIVTSGTLDLGAGKNEWTPQLELYSDKQREWIPHLEGTKKVLPVYLQPCPKQSVDCIF